MRRFFCVKCQKMKRVQQWPALIINIESPLPEERIGECNHHANGRLYQSVGRTVAREINRPVKVTKTSKRKAS